MRTLFVVLALALFPAALAQAQNGYCYALKAGQSPNAGSRQIPCRVQVKDNFGSSYVITWGNVKHVVRPSTVDDSLILNNLNASRTMLHKDDFSVIPLEYYRDAMDGHLFVECFRNSRETVCYALP